MDKLKKLEIGGVLFGISFGTLMHFTYAWSGENILVGVFSAINESVWEHTKLIVTPILIFMLLEWRFLKNPALLLKAKAIELTFGVLFIIAFFYTYTGALGIEEILIVDIISFYIAVIIGKYISYIILKGEKKVGSICKVISGILIIVFISLQITFTIKQPDVPMFIEHTSEDHDH